MPLFGSHLSISGGYYKAVDEARRVGADCVQIFTKNNNQWRAKAITPDEVSLFKDRLAKNCISHPLSHASYLINLASPADELWQKSIEGLVVELQRAEQLGIPYVVVHPGSHTTSSIDEGIARISLALDQIHQQTANLATICLLENTAGQGSNLGHQFEQLGAMVAGCKQPDRVGICFDTCHAFAAGYAQATAQEFKAMWQSFDAAVGLKRLKAIHLNDSKKELGSHVDRHEHIGLGHLGLEPFRHLINDKRFADVPMYLETPKEDNGDEPWDVTNLRVLRGMIK